MSKLYGRLILGMQFGIFAMIAEDGGHDIAGLVAFCLAALFLLAAVRAADKSGENL